ncbi:FtsB family cell division protein [Actinomyces mediterranea]|uniref:FtsB family cell division protein n=1 Tax=Actinomyces mediterranea TaxID=1871028 RepID=UPI0009712020|nr:septum formation initiator family protein [Actinomyces mediterranea]
MSSNERPGRPHAPRRPSRTTGSSACRSASAAGKGGGDAKAKSHRTSRETRTAASSASGAKRDRGRSASRPRTSTSRLGHDAGRDEARAKRINDSKSFTIGGLEISTRLFTTVLLAGVLAFLLVPNLYDWWRQEQDYRDIRARVAAAEQRNANMREQLELWEDPEYIASQARARLGYVKPGETQYTVVDPGDDYLDQAQVSAAEVRGPARPWVQVVGILLREADEAPLAVADSQSGVQSGVDSAAQSGE